MLNAKKIPGQEVIRAVNKRLDLSKIINITLCFK